MTPEYPAGVAGFLQGLFRGERAPAYLLVDPQGTLRRAGGELEGYGLHRLVLDRPVFDQVIFLEGLLPLEESPLALRLVETPSGAVADVHLFEGEDGDWVVLLDSTAEEQEQFGLQQKANEVTLLREREARLRQRLEERNRQLAEREARLAEMNEFKNAMLGMAAHDLRSPIGLILNYCLFLLEDLEGHLSEDHQSFLVEIRDSSRFMSRMLSDLLDVNKIESGKLDLNSRPVDLVGLLQRNLTLGSMMAERKGIELVLDSEPHQTLEVELDPDRIEQVLGNLISNAIKYSHQDTRITVRLDRDEEQARVSVADQGQGIPTDQLDRLFKPFGKTTVRPTGDERSTGLGLAICKRILEEHRGSIGVQSRVGHGSTFWITLPIGGAANEGSDLPDR